MLSLHPRFAALFVILAVATFTPQLSKANAISPGAEGCDADDMLLCCQTVESAATVAAIIARVRLQDPMLLIPPGLEDSNELVGVSCSSIIDIGVSSNTCDATTVCCGEDFSKDFSFVNPVFQSYSLPSDGLLAIECVPPDSD
ncbi:hypothetical protein SCHPADRAFT_943519 [Schizopora paradoxa]|uniref:Hydrophobin n=1 Tax=Schizopora paradoxa TaxID=27342 RepID=A0A0H2RJG5_9AGAM|nr:hypothetical protein SCHPADRAFT_943519 [Schizopora paradoxa]